ncbi:hypothetical protein [Nocardia lijiangensis]|uniref:hypothetical protein n=1 Tax=Nocardia lijiangensis TaxID=299618 RepID=UPI000835C697|nr:hypothetical protein [Nocardia lijiangensis]
MNLSALFKPAESLGGRFFLVGMLPTYAAAVFLAVLVWAGAPGPLHFTAAWRTASALGLGEVLLFALLITLVAFLLHPLQQPMLRLLEGYYWLRWLAAPGRWYHGRKRGKLAKASAPRTGSAPDQQTEDRMAAAYQRLRLRYPAPERLRPTLLGNVLAAAESTAGADYGFEAVVAWPRLFPLLSEPVRTIVDDRRNQIDLAARITFTGATTSIVAVVLLSRSGWWLLLALAPAALAVLAYTAAVQAAVGYGEALRVAFDLHRFDLLDALRLPLPADPSAEQSANTELCRFWRQGVALDGIQYRHPS